MALVGKTYTLQGESTDSSVYYRLVAELADECEDQFGVRDAILDNLLILSRYRSPRRWSRSGSSFTSLNRFVRTEAQPVLQSFLHPLPEHLRTLPMWRRWDRTLAASAYQYVIYMLFIELLNRHNRSRFQTCDVKWALLPHCLRASIESCKARSDGIDRLCAFCTRACPVAVITRLLKRHEITPYIWMSMDYQKLGKKLQQEHKRLGIFGIACIPELFAGMRACYQHNIPVLGMPLEANRCRRWMGRFLPNMINFTACENLLQ